MVDIVTYAMAKKAAGNYTDEAIDRALTSVYTYKGRCTHADLANKPKEGGAVWEMSDSGATWTAGQEYCYDPSANQWVAMAGHIHVDIINTLDSTDTQSALSAAMGKALGDRLDVLENMVVVAVTVTGGTVSGRTVTATPSDPSLTVVTGTTDEYGSCLIKVGAGVWTLSGDAQSGYLTPSQAVTAVAGATATVTLAYLANPTVAVTSDTSTGHESGVTVTASDGTHSYTAVTDTQGACTIALQNAGTFTLSATVSGYDATFVPASVTAAGGQTYSSVMSLAEGSGWKFSMAFDATTFQTDPTGCLTYGDDCEGYTPVSSPPAELGACQTMGSWSYNNDGTSDNPLLDGCFYATFTSGGVLHERLDPNDLSQKIATWNDTSKEWESATGSSSRATEDTMFCIPTLYLASTETSISMSTDSTEGTAYAHTIGGHTYQYLAIGVYPGNVTSNVMYSKSGAESTVSTTRPTFRAAATGKTIANGHAMVWNFHQWQLLRIMTIFAMKSFNGKSQIGQGGYKYGARASGHTNAMGPFAGSTSTTESTTTGVKAFVEDWWGHNGEFIDDFVNGLGTAGICYIGQNAVPDDTNDNKTAITLPTDAGFCNVVQTAMPVWGIPSTTGNGASSSTGLCNYFYGTTGTSGYLGQVGGYSGSVTSGYAGPSYLNTNSLLSSPASTSGARMAFVFDLTGGA